jgi:L-seryl-tRNA(Ser) seleniumtransferase
MTDTELRRLPSVDKVISNESIKQLLQIYPHDLIVDLVRQRLEKYRLAIISGDKCPSLETVISSVTSDTEALFSPHLRPVVNASGVILHTNLGRAPLSREAIAAMDLVSRGYCNLTFDLDTGSRGSRHVHIEQLLCRLTGAEAALVVNNNASAVMLGLTALAKRKEVIVSRGQAVEIGGGFRVPDVMKQSGAKLIEVGTTNCTYDYDYDQAVTERTAALLRVHTSNFRVEGFTHDVTIEEMTAVGRKHDTLVLDDLGSGCLLDTTAFGLIPEPMVQHSITHGVDLVFFSGDKLVGGPQAGIIVGKKVYVDKLKKHPLVRALRIDKIIIAGLAATLTHYLKGEALEKIPVWRMVSTPLDAIETRAANWAAALPGFANVVIGESTLGGGSLPGGTLLTMLVAIKAGSSRKGSNMANLLSQQLRRHDPPVIGRVGEDTLYLDPRTVLPEEDDIMLHALSSLKSSLK